MRRNIITFIAVLVVFGLFGSPEAALAQKGPNAVRNLALGKPAQQSSRSQWSKPNDPQGAVDGVKNGSYGFHTKGEVNPWWQVDLGAVSSFDEIAIYNRMDFGPERSRNIRVLLSNDGSSWRTAYTHDGTNFGGIRGTPLRVRLAGERARFVRLQLADQTYLHLDEVEVLVGSSEQPPATAPTPPAAPQPSARSGRTLPIDISGSWSYKGSRNQVGRVNIWQNGQHFTVITSWPSTEADHKAGIWKSYKGEGTFQGRQMVFKVMPSNRDGRSADQGYVYHWTISNDNSRITGYYTRHGKKTTDHKFDYHKVK